ncbi:hypothetical protein Tco_0011572 [Tanacetum coccineum]
MTDYRCHQGLLGFESVPLTPPAFVDFTWKEVDFVQSCKGCLGCIDELPHSSRLDFGFSDLMRRLVECTRGHLEADGDCLGSGSLANVPWVVLNFSFS